MPCLQTTVAQFPVLTVVGTQSTRFINKEWNFSMLGHNIEREKHLEIFYYWHNV
jgi:hypothetical protein